MGDQNRGPSWAYGAIRNDYGVSLHVLGADITWNVGRLKKGIPVSFRGLQRLAFPWAR